ncbi:MAG: rhodanese-like domain-containing protein, partial [Actinomycetes bacterium]
MIPSGPRNRPGRIDHRPRLPASSRRRWTPALDRARSGITARAWGTAGWTRTPAAAQEAARERLVRSLARRCGTPSRHDPTERGADVDPKTVNSRRGQVQLLDVREDDEWSAGRIDGATHIPLSQLPARLDELDRDRTVVTVCRS